MEDIDLRCCDVADMLASLPDGCASLVMADPPWEYDNGQSGTSSLKGLADPYYGGVNDFQIASHTEASYRVARLDSYLAVWATFPKLMDWARHNGLVGSIGWTYISGGAWGKTNGLGVGVHVRGDAELLLLYRKGSPRPLVTTSNLWLADRVGHSEKPQKALRALVEMAVPPGGLVVDLYAGASASLAIACRSLGRRYVGAEIDSARHALAILRLSQQEMAFSA